MKRELHKALAMLLTLVLILTVVPVVSVEAASGTIYGGLDYSPVYDYNYYISKYDDLKKAFGSNKTKAFNHFIKYGMWEGRQASANFNVQVYKANYVDLQVAFKDSLPAYYKHYLEFGIKEGRTAVQYASRYKCIVRIDNKAGELTSNQVSTVSISYARNTTASFSFNGWARVENGISNITYDITHKQTGTKYIIGNQATVLGLKNAQERSFQVECIQLIHLKTGENVINVFATDKSGKREAIGCIIVNVIDVVPVNEWSAPVAATDGTRTLIATNTRTGKQRKISSVAEFKAIYGEPASGIANFVYTGMLKAAFGEVKVYNSLSECIIDNPKNKQAALNFLKSNNAPQEVLDYIKIIDENYLDASIVDDIQKLREKYGWIPKYNNYLKICVDMDNYNTLKEPPKWMTGINKINDYSKKAEAGYYFYGLIKTTDANEALMYFTGIAKVVSTYDPILSKFVAADIKYLKEMQRMCNERIDFYNGLDIQTDMENDGKYEPMDQLDWLIDKFQGAVNRKEEIDINRYGNYINQFVLEQFIEPYENEFKDK